MGWLPAPTWWLSTAITSSERSDIIFWPRGPPGMLVMHIYTSRQNTQMHFLKVLDSARTLLGPGPGSHQVGMSLVSRDPHSARGWLWLVPSGCCDFTGGLQLLRGVQGLPVCEGDPVGGFPNLRDRLGPRVGAAFSSLSCLPNCFIGLWSWFICSL